MSQYLYTCLGAGIVLIVVGYIFDSMCQHAIINNEEFSIGYG